MSLPDEWDDEWAQPAPDAGRAPAQVLGWPCPWSGDEYEPVPRSYWLWFRLYRRARVIRHWFGVHDWEIRFGFDPASRGDDGSGIVRMHCDWCGESITRPLRNPV